ncbi:MAG: trypsin-like serine protease [Dorea sp.]|nr:trypsin-like serine protease [Dorea sp.]
MDHQYNYYTSGQDANQQNNQGQRPPLKKRSIPKWIKTMCLGLIFGVTASAAFQTSNIIAARFLNAKSEKEDSRKTETVGNAKLTTSSDSAVKSDVADIADNAMPSVVSITNMSVQQVQSFFGGIQERESQSAGSGIIIGQNDKELLIVTNNHVVEGSDTLTVSFIDEESVEANVKGTDAGKDLAIIAVELDKIKNSTMEKIAVATLGDSEQIQVGEEAIAIGNALGYGQSVTRGIISATGRSIDGIDSSLIQTDAAINPGNSGGALLNAKGEVIGINTAKAAMNAVEGMGYAIPVSEARETIETLMNRETRTKVAENERGYLGIRGEDVSQDISQMYNMPTGVYIAESIKGGGADRAGITKGSVITALNGISVTGMESLQEQLQYYKIGEKVTVTVQVPGNDGEYKSQDVDVVLVSSSN